MSLHYLQSRFCARGILFCIDKPHVHQVIISKVFHTFLLFSIHRSASSTEKNEGSSMKLLVVVMDKLLIKFAKEESKANKKKSRMIVVGVKQGGLCNLCRLRKVSIVIKALHGLQASQKSLKHG